MITETEAFGTAKADEMSLANQLNRKIPISFYEGTTGIEPVDDTILKINNDDLDKMFNQLSAKMNAVGWDGVDEVRTIWEDDYRNRKSISEFIKDGMIGKKRLASMPDRVSNTIITSDKKVVTRPTVINCYEGGCDIVMYCKGDLNEMRLIYPFVQVLGKKEMNFFYNEKKKIIPKIKNNNKFKSDLIKYNLISNAPKS